MIQAFPADVVGLGKSRFTSRTGPCATHALAVGKLTPTQILQQSVKNYFVPLMSAC